MKDLTVGSPMRLLLGFSIPLMISMVFQQLYNISDSVICGNFAADKDIALAAVSAAFPVSMIFVSLAFGCSIGCQVIVSQLFGAKDFSRLKTAFYTSLISVVVAAVVVTGAGLLFLDPLLVALKTPPDIFADTRLYTQIVIYATVFVFLYNACNGISAAMGDSQTPLVLLICSSVGNIIVSYVFVKHLNMGVAGAGWATLICQGISAVVAALVLLHRFKKIDAPHFIIFSPAMLRKILTIAVPSILQQVSISCGNLIIQAVVNGFGATTVAGYGTASKINLFVIAVIGSFGTAISTYTAQNYGAGREDRIHGGLRSALVMVSVVSLLCTALCYIFVNQMIGFFMDGGSANAEGIIESGSRMIMFTAPVYWVVCVKLLIDGVLRGRGLMVPFMVATMADLGARVVLAFVFSSLFGENGLWAAWPIGWFSGMICSSLLYKYFVFRRVPVKAVEENVIAAEA